MTAAVNGSANATASTAPDLGRDDPAFLRAFCGVPTGVTDAEVLAGVEAVRGWHAAQQAETLARARAAALTSDWRDTVPGESSFVPFPTEVFPGPVADHVRAQAAALDVDEAAVAVAHVVALAAAVGNAYAVSPKRSWTERAAVWAVLVMPSGAKKSGAVEAGVGPALSIEADARAEADAEAERHRAELSQWEELSAAEKKRTPKPAEPARAARVRVGNTTVESVATVHADNPRGLLLYRDELSAWLGSFDSYKSGDADLANWIEMCGGRAGVIDRKSDKDRPTLHVSFPNVCVVGTTQPGTLRQRMSPGHFSTGFAARLLFVEPPTRPRRWTDADVTADVAEGYARLIRDLYAVPMPPDGPAVLPLAPAALALFVEFVNAHGRLMGRAPDGPLVASLSKAEGYALRFALALHVADAALDGRASEPGPVSASALSRGLRLARWFAREQARVYARHGFAEATMDRDERNARKLAETFAWKDVADVWEVGKSGAYVVVDRLLSKGLAEDEAHGSYRRTTTGGPDAPGGLVDFLDYGAGP